MLTAGSRLLKIQKPIPKSQRKKRQRNPDSDHHAAELGLEPVTRGMNEPGWPTIIAVSRPCRPYNASITGKPTNDVLPSPPIKIRQPISLLDQLNFLPSIEKTKKTV